MIQAEDYQAEDMKFLRKATAMNKTDYCSYKIKNALENENFSSKFCSETRKKDQFCN